MYFHQIPGQEQVKAQLIKSVAGQRISHAQLLLAYAGNGALPLAVAYARYILCTQRSEQDACGTCPSCIKINKLAHPDLHIVFPVVTTEKIKKPTSSLLLNEFREAFLESPFMGYFDWLEKLEAGNKQGLINVEETSDILQKLSLKAYEGEYRIVLIWYPECMNASAANKMLKILEEPPEKTLFLLVSEAYDKLLPTIQSRLQLVKTERLQHQTVADYIAQQTGMAIEKATEIALTADGNLHAAIQAVNLQEESESQLDITLSWLRLCYKRSFPELIKWTEQQAGMPRESLKQLLTFSCEMIREALLINYRLNPLTRSTGEAHNALKKLAPLINEKNILQFNREIDRALYDLERNANPKIVLLDLSLRVHALLHVA